MTAFNQFKKPVYQFLLGITLTLSISFTAAAQDLGKGFFDYGVASPISNDRGIVATVDGDGRDVALAWLFDHRGSYALLMIDAETGKSQQFEIPFKTTDAVYCSILSSKNKFYTLFGDYFIEFDPVKRAFTFTAKAMHGMAMGMTEDDKGVIWTVTYPNSDVVSFDPQNRKFKDYGYLYKQNWLQYPRYMATDKSGWVYFALGNTASQIIAFNPLSGETKPIFTEPERKRGTAYVYNDQDGKVYGQALKNDKDDWYELNKGARIKNLRHNSVKPMPIIVGAQNLFHRKFPDGKEIKELDLQNKKLVVEDPRTKATKEVKFEYTSEGAIVMGVITSSRGTIVGGTTFPMRFFSYDPKSSSWTNVNAFGQFNALARRGNHVYFGDYPTGALLEWDASKPWIETKKDAPTNPLFIASANPVIHRPTRVLAYPDGKTIIMGGSPEYGYTGGGLLFWDSQKKIQTVIPDSAVVLDQSTMSLVALPKGKLLGGTTIAPGTGGERKANEAEIYIMDMATKRVEWHKVILPGIHTYTDLCMGRGNLIYGIADRKTFFVLDPVKRVIVHQQDLESRFGSTISNQSPRVFVFGPKGEIYLLFVKGIAKLDPVSYQMTMVESPVPVEVGGDYLDGRIYFVSGSHLCSYQLPDTKKQE